MSPDQEKIIKDLDEIISNLEEFSPYCHERQIFKLKEIRDQLPTEFQKAFSAGQWDLVGGGIGKVVNKPKRNSISNRSL